MRTVFCRKYQKDMPGLDRAPLPGQTGEQIFNEVSKQAWQDWLRLQVMLINEKQLSLADAQSRKWLTEQMLRFFDNQPTESPKGYTPQK